LIIKKIKTKNEINDKLIDINEEADDLSMTNGGPEAFMLFLIYESIKTLFISAVFLECKK
jgi:hypothetical protein